MEEEGETRNKDQTHHPTHHRSCAHYQLHRPFLGLAGKDHAAANSEVRGQRRRSHRGVVTLQCKYDGGRTAGIIKDTE